MTITTDRDFSVRQGLGNSSWGGEQSGIPRPKMQWRTLTKTYPDLHGACVISGDRVVAGMQNGDLRGLDRANGKQLWQCDTQYGGVVPDLVAVGNLLFAGDVVVELASGEVVARISEQSGVGAIPKTIGQRGEGHFWKALDPQNQPGDFICFDVTARSCEIVKLPALFGVVSPGGKHLVGRSDEPGAEQLRGVTLASRQIDWTIPFSFENTPQFVYADDASFYAQELSQIQKIDAQTGETLWCKDYAKPLGLSSDHYV